MRDYMLRVRASEDEIAAIKERAKASGETMSEHVRLRAKRRAIEACEPLAGEEDIEAIRQAGRILKGVLDGTEKADVIKKAENVLEELCRGHQAD